MEEEKIEPVNCAAVVRAVKDAGAFALMDWMGEHFVVTESFILMLRKRDAFKIQCKLEVEKRNCYYEKEKSKWVESGKLFDGAAVWEKYHSTILLAESKEELTPTGVAIIAYDSYPMNGILYAGADGYSLLRGDYLNMICTCLEIVRLGEMVVINGSHIVALMVDDAWKQNSFVVQYEREGKE